MRNFRTKKVSLKMECTCVEINYFKEHYSDYYEFLGCDVCESKIHGFYLKEFYKRKSIVLCNTERLDLSSYEGLPRFVCASILY